MTNISTMDTLTQLHDLHERLVRAQHAENNAIRKLSEYTASGNRSAEDFNALLAEVHAARQRTVDIYDAWNRRILALHPEAAAPPRRDPQLEQPGSPPA